jgi:hypothetical protein
MNTMEAVVPEVEFKPEAVLGQLTENKLNERSKPTEFIHKNELFYSFTKVFYDLILKNLFLMFKILEVFSHKA